MAAKKYGSTVFDGNERGFTPLEGEEPKLSLHFGMDRGASS
jgi:hypothetical protein